MHLQLCWRNVFVGIIFIDKETRKRVDVMVREEGREVEGREQEAGTGGKDHDANRMNDVY